MKNIVKKIASFALVCVFMLCTLTACGDKEITNLKVKEGTLKYTYLQNSNYSFDDLKVIVFYNDETNVEVGMDDEKLTVSEFSTAAVGDFKVTITYDTKSIEVTLKVTNNEDELYEIYDIDYPASITARQGTLAETSNYENQYYENNHLYVVGDDNPFKFFPKVIALNDNDEQITINSFKSVAKLYKKVDGTYTEVNIADYTDSVDDMNQTYDFNNNAIGETFKLEVRPYRLSEEQLLNVSDYTISHEFKVVDGYNVTEANELVVMTNYTHDDDVQIVEDAKTFLTNNNITPVDVNGIVLHNNLTITKDNLPANYFTEVNGTVYLKDYADLYAHHIETGKTFNFYGNYYTVDFSNLPKVKIKDGETSHTTAFRLTSDPGVNEATVNTATSFVYDAAFIGNANRSEDETRTAGIAGLILVKAENHTTTFDNCLMRTFFLHLMTDRWHATTMNINHVKSYDSYQNSLFVWGGTVNLTHSEFKRAGGPLMILQHRDVDEYNGDPENDAIIDLYAPIVNVDNDTVLESFVTGYESWFSTMGASKTATFLAALAKTFDGTGKTYVTEQSNSEGTQKINAMNLIAVTMAAGEDFEAVVSGSDKALGKVMIDNKVVTSKYSDNMNNIKEGLSQVPLIQALVKNAVLNGMLEANDGQLKAAFVNATGLDTFITNKRDDYNTLKLMKETQGEAAFNSYLASNSDAATMYSIISTYDAQVSSSENVQNAISQVMKAAPVFQSSAQGYGFLYTSESLDNLDKLEGNELVDLINSFSLNSNSNDLFSGNYLGVYYLGLGITLGYYSTTTAN